MPRVWTLGGAPAAKRYQYETTFIVKNRYLIEGFDNVLKLCYTRSVAL